MAGLKRMLGAGEMASLITAIVDDGESLETYREFCDRWDIPPDRQFKDNYFFRWCQNHRRDIQLRRKERFEELQRGSALTRERRLYMLEDMTKRCLEEISAKREEAMSVSDILKIMEQSRKMLQQIAQERGEWDVKGSRDDDREKPMDKDVVEGFAKHFADRKRLAELKAVN